MTHDHDHDHAGHSHGPPATGGQRLFALATALNLTFVVIEVVFGVLARSTALLADAAHNATDVIGLLLAWGAAALATKPPTARRTYGFRAATVLAALANVLLILVAVGGVGWEAIHRARTSTPVEGRTVMIVALVGVVVNAAAAGLFARGRKGDANMRAAFVHLITDALVSVGVAMAGLLVMLTGHDWIDPVASLVIMVVILVGTFGLLRETANLAVAGVPSHIDLDAVQRYLETLSEVREVHDLHVWPMSTTEVALTAHLVMPWPTTSPEFLVSVAHDLEMRFGIHHVTVQLEDCTTGNCAQAPAHVV